MALFGNAFAKNEEFLTSVLHSLCRDPRIGTRMQLGLADKTAESLLKTVKDSQTPFYLQSLINQNITDGNLPRLNLQIVLANMYGRGRDTYIPYFIQDGADVKIDGLALFNGSRFVHRIGMRDTFLLKILVNPVKNGRYQVELEDEGRKGWALLRNMHAKTRYTVTQIDPVPAVAIDLHMQALLKDLPPWIEIKEKSKVRQIEVQLNKQFQEAIQRLIASFQRYGVDPIGFGDLIQGQARGWDIRSFDKTYPDMKTNVNVKINILQTGSGE